MMNVLCSLFLGYSKAPPFPRTPTHGIVRYYFPSRGIFSKTGACSVRKMVTTRWRQQGQGRPEAKEAWTKAGWGLRRSRHGG